jgi:hypothetical protein
MMAIVAAAVLAFAAVSLAVPRLLPTASAATKTLYTPPSWANTGEVPWASNRSKESANFILLWGEKSGTDPKTAPSPYTFDPDSILTQLEKLYTFYVSTIQFTPETGLLAQYKIDVIITQTWNNTNLHAWATIGCQQQRLGPGHLPMSCRRGLRQALQDLPLSIRHDQSGARSAHEYTLLPIPTYLRDNF